MTRAEQDRLAAEIGVERRDDPAQEELDRRSGFDMTAYVKRMQMFPAHPMIYPGVDS